MLPAEQLRRLSQTCGGASFAKRLERIELLPLKATGIAILQLNITRRCNLSCKHCHVGGGPKSTEFMSHRTLEACVAIGADPRITTIDLTGGAPEMHPEIRWLLVAAAQLGKRLIVRSNLVVLLEEGSGDLVELFVRHGIELVGSLPDYRKERSERQRGSGTFERSIEAIRRLNVRGYGIEGSGLVLDLVHNPAGAYLPGAQEALEREYREQLLERHGVRFNRLFCLTNCPIGRYLDYLIRSDNVDDYMRELDGAFNPAAARNVMCRTTLSVGWDGRLYDCDFNQMLGMVVNSGAPKSIAEFDFGKLAGRQITIDNHCFACTAGAGSSCQGATAG